MWFTLYFYGTALIVALGLLLTQCIFPQCNFPWISSARWAGGFSWAPGQQKWKSPRYGAKESEDKLQPSKHFCICPSLYLPAEIFRSNATTSPESYVSSSFGCSDSEPERVGDHGKHSSQMNQFVTRTIQYGF